MTIPHSASAIGACEEKAVMDVIQRNYVGHGPIASQLEDAFVERIGSGFIRAVSSGSFALLIALKALDLPIASCIALPILTCPSVLNAIQLAGYTPILVDIHSENLTINVNKIPIDVKAIVAPHAYGAPVDVDALNDLGIPWIEDCATSPATTWENKPVGQFGTLAIFSLGSTKYITGGMGGVIVAHDEIYSKRIEDMLSYDSVPTQTNWKTQNNALVSGHLADINAAMALVQIKRLEDFLAHRRYIAQIYTEQLEISPAIASLPSPQSNIGHSYYRYIIKTAIPTDDIIRQLREAGIGASPSVNPWLDDFIENTGYYPIADSWKEHLISLPIHMHVNEDNAYFIASTLKNILHRVSE